MGEIFRSALTENDLIDSDTVTCSPGQFVKLGERKVEAGELITIGYGMQSGQQSAQGRIYANMATSTGGFNGTVRLSVYSPQNRPLRILAEYRAETLRTDANDRTLQVPLPENMTWISEDNKLVLEFAADAQGTLDKAATEILMDTTTEAL